MDAALSTHRGGAGETLVLIHGIGSRWQVWRPLLPALESRFDVIALDLPGFGASPVAAGVAGVDEHASAVSDFVGSLGIKAFHAAGNSLGGGVALELGRRGVARSVTAFAPVGFWGGMGRRWCQASVSGARVLSRVLTTALPGLVSSPIARTALFAMFFAHPARLDPRECLADAAALRASPGFEATRDALAQWRFSVADLGALGDMPVTVAWGRRDAILPRRRQARRAAAALPRARHEALASCGHLPFSDDPQACARLIISTSAMDAAGSASAVA